MDFRCEFHYWTMGMDPPLATLIPYSQCSTSHSILQSHCFLDTHSFIKNSRWIRHRIDFLFMTLQYDHYWFFLHRFACHSQHPQGSWHLRCMVFLWQYRAVVHWNRGLPSVSEPTQITLLSLLFELSSCARFTRALLLVWDVARHGISTPFLKKCFFLSDSRFVIRAIYIPCLFQPLPRW